MKVSYLNLLIVFFTILSATPNTQAFSVKLTQKLGAYESQEFNSVQRLSDSTFQIELYRALRDLKIKSSDGFYSPLGKKESSLSDQDQRIILETELQRLSQFTLLNIGSTGEEGRMSGLARSNGGYKIHQAFAIAEQSKKSIEQLVQKPNPDSVNFITQGEGISAKIENLVWSRWLIFKFEELSRNDSRGPEFWKPLVDKSYEIVRSQLKYYDQDIKVLATFQPEVANVLANEAISILLAIDSDQNQNQKAFERIFKDLPDGFTMNIRAHRNFTRLIDWVHYRVASPIRVWAFRLTVMGALIAGGADLIGAKETADAFTALTAVTGPTWGILFFENYFGARQLLTGVARLFDEAVNRIASSVSPNRRGALTQAAEERLDHMSCENLFL